MADTPKGKISLLLADVDGTLVTKDKVLTERAVAAVRAMEKAGIRFAITSGRPPRGMAMLIEPLKISTPIAGFNGGAMVKPDMTVVEEKTLPPDVARETLKLMRDGGLDAWLYTAEDWFILKRDAPHVDREAWTVKFEPKVVGEFADQDLDKAVKITGCSDDLQRVEKIEAEAQSKLGEGGPAAPGAPP